jgi:polar amino acid transport system ATP-binding protein
VTDQSPPVIEITGLHKSFGALEVLRGVDLTARAGDVVSLIGSSGSGKSTLLRCANLLEDSQQGEIIFEGEPVTWRGKGPGAPPGGRRTGPPHPHEPVDGVPAVQPLGAYDDPAKRHGSASHGSGPGPRRGRGPRAAHLDKVGIHEKCDAYPAQLSGGQQQRAAIARALCMEPRALLFDEPTSALDPELEQEVVRVIRGLAEEGRTMLLVTHDMRMARDLSDRIIFLHQGLVEEEGRPSSCSTPRAPTACGNSSATARRPEPIETKPTTKTKQGDFQ